MKLITLEDLKRFRVAHTAYSLPDEPHQISCLDFHRNGEIAAYASFNPTNSCLFVLKIDHEGKKSSNLIRESHGESQLIAYNFHQLRNPAITKWRKQIKISNSNSWRERDISWSTLLPMILPIGWDWWILNAMDMFNTYLDTRRKSLALILRQDLSPLDQMTLPFGYGTQDKEIT